MSWRSLFVVTVAVVALVAGWLVMQLGPPPPPPPRPDAFTPPAMPETVAGYVVTWPPRDGGTD